MKETIHNNYFHKKKLVLELSSKLSFKEKKILKEYVTKPSGILSYIVTKDVWAIVIDDEKKLDSSFKCKQARKHGIPIIFATYLKDCLEENRQLLHKDYLAEKTVDAQKFEKGQISVVTSQATKQVTINPQNVKEYDVTDSSQPNFPEKFEYGKGALFSRQAKEGLNFCCVEINVSTEDDGMYRIRTEKATWARTDFKNRRTFFRYAQNADDALCIFEHVTQQLGQQGFKKQSCKNYNIGSKAFQQHEWESSDNIDREILQLVKMIWKEALGDVTELISRPLDKFSLSQVTAAEATLLQLKEAILKKEENDKIQELSDLFYQKIPHIKVFANTIKNMSILSAKTDLCQLLRDVISVRESVGVRLDSNPLAQLKSLRNQIHLLSPKTEEFKTVTSLLGDANGDDVIVRSVYRLWRQAEDANFKHEFSNRRYLFHASKPGCFVGILSRGLLMPNVVVTDHGGLRSDPGMLGNGIYFTDDPRTAAKYSRPFNERGTRLMVVNEVALGKIWVTGVKDTSLAGPPEGYDSVHGAKDAPDTEFKDDEYVIYDVTQQRMMYLVEFSLPVDDVKPLPVSADDDVTLDINEAELKEEVEEENKEEEFEEKLDVDRIRKLEDPLEKVKAGLQTKNETPVPLKSVHIRAKMVDLASQVVVLQEYFNENNVSIEAKYVFPLDDLGAVCGFEAFINDKHIVGKVKEKEKAQKEYREAISKGHGAYLMDQETPDVFTVSVGNLPPRTRVLIKITYVAELRVDHDDVIFQLPGSVAPWIKDPALGANTQGDLETIAVNDASDNFSLTIAIEMPFEIREIKSPTHRLRVKKTATKAVVQLPKNNSLGDGFTLQVALSSIHVPRMLVERHPETGSEACMLTFYPEFETQTKQTKEIIFLLDCSNSMKGNSLRDAQTLLSLALDEIKDQKDVVFNVVLFGTKFEEVFVNSRKTLAANIDAAKNFAQKASASMGNTDAWRPLQVLNLFPASARLRSVIIFSDGHVNNDVITVQGVGRNRGLCRVFTCAVGTSCNRHLLSCLARVGAGAHEYFDPKTKSKWLRKIRRQMERAGEPSLGSVDVEWKQHDDDALPVQQAPTQIHSLFNGARQVVYGYVNHCRQASLRASVNGVTIDTVVSCPDLSVTEGKILHILTARNIIRDWEDGTLHSDETKHEMEKTKKKDYIIELSKEHQIVTEFTSFVAVEEREKGEKRPQGPKIEELVQKEEVDFLQELGWEEEEGESEIIEEVNDKAARLLKEATFAGILQSAKLCDELQEILPEVEVGERKNMAAGLAEVMERLGREEEAAQIRSSYCKTPIDMYVKTLTGKTITNTLNLEDDVIDLMNLIQEKEGIPLEQQRLIYNGRQLSPGQSLSSQGIADASCVHMVLRLRGSDHLTKDPPSRDQNRFMAYRDKCESSSSSSSDSLEEEQWEMSQLEKLDSKSAKISEKMVQNFEAAEIIPLRRGRVLRDSAPSDSSRRGPLPEKSEAFSFAPPPSRGGLFGSGPPAPPPQGPAFGAAPTSGGFFGGTQLQGPAFSKAAPSGGLFGSGPAPPGSSFGAAPPTGLFGSGPAPRGSSFGAAPPTGLFGSGPAPPGSSFGAAPPGGLFGSGPAPPGSSFGAAPPTGLFGSGPAPPGSSFMAQSQELSSPFKTAPLHPAAEVTSRDGSAPFSNAFSFGAMQQAPPEAAGFAFSERPKYQGSYDHLELYAETSNLSEELSRNMEERTENLDYFCLDDDKALSMATTRESVAMEDIFAMEESLERGVAMGTTPTAEDLVQGNFALATTEAASVAMEEIAMVGESLESSVAMESFGGSGMCAVLPASLPLGSIKTKLSVQNLMSFEDPLVELAEDAAIDDVPHDDVEDLEDLDDESDDDMGYGLSDNDEGYPVTMGMMNSGAMNMAPIMEISDVISAPEMLKMADKETGSDVISAPAPEVRVDKMALAEVEIAVSRAKLEDDFLCLSDEEGEASLPKDQAQKPFYKSTNKESAMKKMASATSASNVQDAKTGSTIPETAKMAAISSRFGAIENKRSEIAASIQESKKKKKNILKTEKVSEKPKSPEILSSSTKHKIGIPPPPSSSKKEDNEDEIREQLRQELVEKRSPRDSKRTEITRSFSGARSLQKSAEIVSKTDKKTASFPKKEPKTALFKERKYGSMAESRKKLEAEMEKDVEFMSRFRCMSLPKRAPNLPQKEEKEEEEREELDESMDSTGSPSYSPTSPSYTTGSMMDEHEKEGLRRKTKGKRGKYVPPSMREGSSISRESKGFDIHQNFLAASKQKEIQKKVDILTHQMQANIDKAMERSSILLDLQSKSSALITNAKTFKKASLATSVGSYGHVEFSHDYPLTWNDVFSCPLDSRILQDLVDLKLHDDGEPEDLEAVEDLLEVIGADVNKLREMCRRQGIKSLGQETQSLVEKLIVVFLLCLASGCSLFPTLRLPLDGFSIREFNFTFLENGSHVVVTLLHAETEVGVAKADPNLIDILEKLGDWLKKNYLRTSLHTTLDLAPSLDSLVNKVFSAIVKING